MKKIIALVSTFFGIFFTTATASADSPLTSTPFYKAYLSEELVKTASEERVMNQDIAEYLADDTNPIDTKAAIINALSWDYNGKTNADTYSQLIYGVSVQGLDMVNLSGDQQFCIGYLMAMDDYFDTSQALNYLQSARSNMSDSLTVAMVTYLAEAMNHESDEWEPRYERIMSDSTLNKDISEDAIKIIEDYMIYSIDHNADTPKTGVFPIEIIFGLGTAATAAGVLLFNRKVKKSII